MDTYTRTHAVKAFTLCGMNVSLMNEFKLCFNAKYYWEQGKDMLDCSTVECSKMRLDL